MAWLLIQLGAVNGLAINSYWELRMTGHIIQLEAVNGLTFNSYWELRMAGHITQLGSSEWLGF